MGPQRRILCCLVSVIGFCTIGCKKGTTSKISTSIQGDRQESPKTLIERLHLSDLPYMTCHIPSQRSDLAAVVYEFYLSSDGQPVVERTQMDPQRATDIYDLQTCHFADQQKITVESQSFCWKGEVENRITILTNMILEDYLIQDSALPVPGLVFLAQCIRSKLKLSLTSYRIVRAIEASYQEQELSACRFEQGSVLHAFQVETRGAETAFQVLPFPWGCPVISGVLTLAADSLETLSVKN